jgi:hypothetical protein
MSKQVIKVEALLMFFLVSKDLNTVLNEERESLTILLPYELVPDFLYLTGELVEKNKLAVKLDSLGYLEVKLDFFFEFHKINVLGFYNRLVGYRKQLLES